MEEYIPNKYFKLKTKKDVETTGLSSEISISINNYEDIFSDFDPRPFSQRALSDDFLMEIRKASKVKTNEDIEIRFLIEEKSQNTRDEAVIKRRLSEHFAKHIHIARKEVLKERNTGLLFIFIGIILLLGATLIHEQAAQQFFFTFIFVVMEPAGWFFTWTGFEKLFQANSIKKSEYDFYKRMSKADINFVHY